MLLCVWKLDPLECLFSFSPVSRGISALTTMMLREYFEATGSVSKPEIIDLTYITSVQTEVEVESSQSQLLKNIS